MDSSKQTIEETLYDEDFYTWTQRQATLIRSGRIDEADLANIAEEIETLGRSERDALESAYRLICLHLLKLMIQPETKTQSWSHTIVRERLHASRLLKGNPGLKPKRAALFISAYPDGRKEAAAETGKSVTDFPAQPPFTLDQIEDESFWPMRHLNSPPLGFHRQLRGQPLRRVERRSDQGARRLGLSRRVHPGPAGRISGGPRRTGSSSRTSSGCWRACSMEGCSGGRPSPVEASMPTS